MARLLWFALGVVAGTAYASTLIHQERLNQSFSDAALDAESPEAKALASLKAQDAQATKAKLADRFEAGAIRVSGFIEEQAHVLADKLRGPVASAPAPSEGGGGGSTAHDVLEAPFPQTDPSRPSEQILQNPANKPPVMLDVTSDQGGMENLR